MAGSILGRDQIIKVNQLYPRIYAEVKRLADLAVTPYEVMNVHFLLEHHDTTELFQVFQELSFLSPREKEALMRAAIFDVLLKHAPTQVAAPVTDNAGVTVVPGPIPLTVYAPPQFKLNVATTTDHKVV